ncbi:FAD-dependent oxidoreductase [Pseudobdellovibrio sp. HCB154]|uniref:FAD-dependent oxidoreductase n=1 Tax=Pseudobdellovibrio sp. HCB154 TaxID=3386277 RepID=UPI0039172E17
MSKPRRFGINRRQFLTTALWGSAGLSLLPLLSSCSTLDEYLIEDQFDFENEVVIIGGGVAGLYAAYELKKNKIPFKIFEASHRLGGKIQTIDKTEWGAFEFRKNDTILTSLAKELNLEKADLDNKTWTFKRGASAFVEELSEIVQGLIPEKQIRLQHQLVTVRKLGARYQLVFQTGQRERMYFARKVILAMPQTALMKVRQLNEIKDVKPILDQLAQARNWANIRVVVPTNQINANFKKGLRINEDLVISAFNKMTSQQTAQVSARSRGEQVLFTFRMTLDHPLRPIQHLEGFMQKVTNSQFTLTSENTKDWGIDAQDSRSSQEIDQNSIAFPAGKLRILCESFAPVMPTSLAGKSSIESLLQLVNHEVQFFKLDI